MIQPKTEFPPSVINPTSSLRAPLKYPINLDPSCVCCYMPDHSTKWYDQSGCGNHGTVTNAVWQPRGRHDYCLYFDGTGDRVTIPDSTLFEGNTPFSIEFWICPWVLPGDGLSRQIIAKNYPAAGSFYMDFNWAAATQITFYIVNNAAVQKMQWSNTIRVLNKWYHIVAVYTGAYMYLYSNGVTRVGVAQNGVTLAGGSVVIGSAGTGVKARIDEFRFYRRALNQHEVLTLYEAGRP